MSEVSSANGKLEEWPVFAGALNGDHISKRGRQVLIAAVRGVASVLRPEEAKDVDSLLSALPDIQMRLVESARAPGTATRYYQQVLRVLRKAGHRTRRQAVPRATKPPVQPVPDVLDQAPVLGQVASWLRSRRATGWKNQVTALRRFASVAQDGVATPSEALHQLRRWRDALVESGQPESLMGQYEGFARSGLRRYIASQARATNVAANRPSVADVPGSVEATPPTSANDPVAPPPEPVSTTLRTDMWPLFVRAAHTFTVSEARDLLLRVAVLAEDFDPERTVLDQMGLARIGA